MRATIAGFCTRKRGWDRDCTSCSSSSRVRPRASTEPSSGTSIVPRSSTRATCSSNGDGEAACASEANSARGPRSSTTSPESSRYGPGAGTLRSNASRSSSGATGPAASNSRIFSSSRKCRAAPHAATRTRDTRIADTRATKFMRSPPSVSCLGSKARVHRGLARPWLLRSGPWSLRARAPRGLLEANGNRAARSRSTRRRLR